MFTAMNPGSIVYKKSRSLFEESSDDNQDFKGFNLLKPMISSQVKTKQLARILFKDDSSSIIANKNIETSKVTCISPTPLMQPTNLSPVTKRPKKIAAETDRHCFCTMKASLLNHSRNCIVKGIPQNHTGLEPETPRGFYCCVDTFKQQSNLCLKWSEGIQTHYIIIPFHDLIMVYIFF